MLTRLTGRPISVDALMAGLPETGRGSAGAIAAAVRAAETAGLKASLGHRARVDAISPLLMPCLLVLNNGGACVLCGFTARAQSGDKSLLQHQMAKVILPEHGGEVTELPLDELQAAYTGEVLYVKVPARLDKRASELKLLDPKRWFWGNILRFFPIYKHVILASVMINLLAIASPLFVMNVYDRVVPNTALDTLWVLAVGVMMAFGFEFLLKNLRSYFVDVAGRNADILIASRLMRQVMGLCGDAKPDSTGTLANNLREFESLRDFFSSTTLLAMVDLPFVALFVAIIYLLGGPLFVVPTIAIPIVVLVGLLLQYPFQRHIEDGFKEAAQKNALLVEIINGLETIKANLAEGGLQRRWEAVVGMHARSASRARTLASFSISFAQLAAQLVSVGIIIFGVYRIAAGELTMGGLIACNILVGRAMAPLGAVAALLTRLQQSRMALKSLDLLMQLPTERQADDTPLHQGSLCPSISFEQVSFQYPNAETLALNNVSLRVEKGERVGIIGRVGSGKSTLGRLVQGLYTPLKGAVKVGEVDIRQVDVADLRRMMAYVSQDNYLFYGSVRENIALGAPFATDAAIANAAEMAGVSDFLRAHPAGFGLQVGERGMHLSGGQRQLVTIARALLLDPELLILDEPTSAMDNATESALRQRLLHQLTDKTLILITHRFSMLPLVERLVVMDHGRIVADGPKNRILADLKSDRIRTDNGGGGR
jgi:ATP-binding cassette subfamily C protein LapB